MKPHKSTKQPPLALVVFGIFGGVFSVVIFGFSCLVAFGAYLDYSNEWSSHRKHAQEIEHAFNDKLLPAAAFVRDFVKREHRLPNQEEFRLSGWNIASTNNGIEHYIDLIRERPQWADSWGVAGTDFMLGTDVPDWNLYYQSWDQKRIEANWE